MINIDRAAGRGKARSENDPAVQDDELLFELPQRNAEAGKISQEEMEASTNWRCPSSSKSVPGRTWARPD